MYQQISWLSLNFGWVGAGGGEESGEVEGRDVNTWVEITTAAVRGTDVLGRVSKNGGRQGQDQTISGLPW